MTRPTSAVVKPTYTRNVRNAQGSARCYAGRANGAGERQQREAFDKGSDTLSREGVNGWPEAANEEGSSYYYRFVMSPGTEAEPEGDLKSWTRDVMAELEVQQGKPLTRAAYKHSEDDATAVTPTSMWSLPPTGSSTRATFKPCARWLRRFGSGSRRSPE